MVPTTPPFQVVLIWKEKIMLSIQDFKQSLNTVLENVTDPGKVSEILTKLHEDYAGALTEYETLTQTAAKLKETNDSLIKSNGELFRKVGLVKEEAEKGAETSPPETETKPAMAPIEDVMEKLIPVWGEK